MKILNKENGIIDIEASYDAISVIEQSIGVITGAFKVDNFNDKIGANEEDVEKIRLYLRNIVEQSQEYLSLAMNDWNNPKINLLKTNFEIQGKSLVWLINSLKVAIVMAPNGEFHALTGHDADYAIDVVHDLENIQSGL